MLGWLYDIPLTLSGYPSWPKMQFITAASLAIFTLAVAGLQPIDNPSWLSRRFAEAAGVYGVFLGIATLIRVMLNVEFGLFEIFERFLKASTNPLPPAPQTAINFIAFGAALICRAHGKKRAVDILCLLVAAHAVTAMSGYIFGTDVLFGYPFKIRGLGISVYTAACCLLLSISLALTQPAGELSRLMFSQTRAGRMARRIFIALVVLPPLLGMLLRLSESAGEFELNLKASLYVVLLVSTLLAITWLTTRQLEREELHARELSLGLERKKEELSSFFELAPEGVLVADLDGRYQEVNSVACRMLGYSKSELQKMRVADLVLPEDLPRLEEHRHELLHTGKANEASEWVLRRKDGSHVHVEVSAKILPDGRWQGFLRDITERKKIETALRESEERLRLIADALPVLISYVDADERYRFNNLKYEEWFHIKLNEITGRRVRDVLGEKAYAEARQNVAAALSGHEVKFELWLPYTGTSPRFVEGIYVPDRSADGKVHGFYAIVSDLTDRKRVEEALRASEERFRTLSNHAPVGIFMTDEKGVLVFVNEEWSRLTECSAAVAMNKGWQCCLHPQDSERVLAVWNSFIASGSTFALEFRILTTSGQTRWVYGSAVSAGKAGGNINCYIGSMIDISVRKKLEEHIRHTRDELEVRVRERTHELQEAHERMLELARETGMAEIATSVLHNVGNVLNSVNSSLSTLESTQKNSVGIMLPQAVELFKRHHNDLYEFLTKDPVGQKLPEFLDSMARDWKSEQQLAIAELKRLAQNIDHINMIVAVQQSYTGATAVMESLVLQELIEDALKINAISFEQRHIKITRQYGENIYGNFEKHKLLQILVNLISNAKIAVMESTAPQKEIILRVFKKADDRACIEVQDNGSGITEQSRPHIFEFGFTTRRGGHGFGLHSSAIAAHDLGGSLSFESKGAGYGATFRLEVPLATARSRAVLVAQEQNDEVNG